MVVISNPSYRGRLVFKTFEMPDMVEMQQPYDVAQCFGDCGIVFGSPRSEFMAVSLTCTSNVGPKSETG
jgi:hypothetical protein